MPNRVPMDPDVGVPDLVRRLGDDSKRLVEDEVQLAKIELANSAHRAGRGAMWLGMAFGIGVVALVALTLLCATLIGRWIGGHMWLGAIITGIVELAIAVLLLKRGASVLAAPPYSLGETRDSVATTAKWVAHPRG